VSGIAINRSCGNKRRNGIWLKMWRWHENISVMAIETMAQHQRLMRRRGGYQREMAKSISAYRNISINGGNQQHQRKKCRMA